MRDKLFRLCVKFGMECDGVIRKYEDLGILFSDVSRMMLSKLCEISL
jgi:hypothetical protein